MQRTQLLATELIAQVEAGHSLSHALKDVLSQHRPSDQERGALYDISYGVMRYWAQLRHILHRLMPKALRMPQLNHLLIVSLYQLYYSHTAPYAVVNESVALARRLSGGRYTKLFNGVLRQALRQREALSAEAALHLVARFNHPQWWIDKVQHYYPCDWQAILAVNNRHPPMTLRINRRKMTVKEYLLKLHTVGLAAKPLGDYAVCLEKPLDVQRLPGFYEGEVSVQDWGAQQLILPLPLRTGMRVLDACAAPGGKTGHILEMFDVEMLALDLDSERLQQVHENLLRLKQQASVLQGNATQPAKWWDRQPFDCIVADVPCSASGVVRRHPDIRWLRRSSDFAKLARQQAAILDALWPLLLKGGKMLYVTCSIFPEENEWIVASFLKRQTNADCLIQKQLLPTDAHDGFYYALLEKN